MPLLRLIATAGDGGWTPWGVAVPLGGALAYIGRWLIKELGDAHRSKDAQTDKVIDQVVPALTDAAKASKDVTAIVEQLHRELIAEREERIRLEERSRRPR